MKSFPLFLYFFIWHSLFAREIPPDWLDPHIENKIRRQQQLSRNLAMTTENQSHFDVHRYQIQLRIDPVERWVYGKVTLRAAALLTDLTQIELDFGVHLKVDSVLFQQRPVLFTHQQAKLNIALPPTNGQFEISIFYQGNPASGTQGAFVFDIYNGKPLVWTLSEPFGARDWWPCKDTPADKADSVDLMITVPENLIVASNGTLRMTESNAGWKTWHWQERYPIATYLVSLAIYEYYFYTDFFKYSATDSMPVEFYVFPDHRELVRENYAKTVPALELFSDIFGPYPFLKEKYGHAEFGWRGGMEHQTITSLGGSSLPLIVHELAHQWWGDMITCRDFHHIWLNEGFATYAEALYDEAVNGKTAYFENMRYRRYLRDGTIYVPELSDWSRIFSAGLSYNKAAWVLHMLRHVVGDAAFFKTLKTYSAAPGLQHGTVVTEDFQKICEDVSGMKLDWFFAQWIYGEFYPVYYYQWATEQTRVDVFQLNLLIEQQPIHEYQFKMPVDVRVRTATSDTTIVVWDSLDVQQFRFSFAEKPISVELDPENWILREAFERPNRFLGNYLDQNFPNPFHLYLESGTKFTTIGYQTTQTGQVRVQVFNLLGQLVKTLVDSREAPGYHVARWDGTDETGKPVASGVYFAELKTDFYRETKKLLLLP
jgi:aminopeptidase N